MTKTSKNIIFLAALSAFILLLSLSLSACQVNNNTNDNSNTDTVTNKNTNKELTVESIPVVENTYSVVSNAVISYKDPDTSLELSSDEIENILNRAGIIESTIQTIKNADSSTMVIEKIFDIDENGTPTDYSEEIDGVEKAHIEFSSNVSETYSTYYSVMISGDSTDDIEPNEQNPNPLSKYNITYRYNLDGLLFNITQEYSYKDGFTVHCSTSYDEQGRLIQYGYDETMQYTPDANPDVYNMNPSDNKSIMANCSYPEGQMIVHLESSYGYSKDYEFEISYNDNNKISHIENNSLSVDVSYEEIENEDSVMGYSQSIFSFLDIWSGIFNEIIDFNEIQEQADFYNNFENFYQ